MRRSSPTKLSLTLRLLAISSVLLLPVTGRTQQTAVKPGELLATITSLDHAFFEAYNKCELSKIESLFTGDIEFYHEKRGQLAGRKSVMEVFSQNLCGDKNNRVRRELDRKSTRLNSSHSQISYAVFCLKKKNQNKITKCS